MSLPDFNAELDRENQSLPPEAFLPYTMSEAFKERDLADQDIY